MSKVTSAYPSYSSSAVKIGDSAATSGLINGIMTSSYDMSDSESSIYNYALNTLAGILPNINIMDSSTRSNIQNSVDAYKTSGISTINDLYNNYLSDLKNDSVSRFGNLDNSIYQNGLSDVETNRANAVNSFAQDVLSKQSELESDELTKRYALIELLSGMSDNIYNRALNAINASLGSSSSANTYNNNLYNAYNALSKTNSSSTSSLASSLLSSLISGSISGGL